jgi:hypothetical protein
VDVLTLSAKSALAVMLLVAGAAKLADLPSFTATVRLFVPYRAPAAVVRGTTLGIAVVELALGAASLSSPAAAWLNAVIVVLAAAFVAVSAFGYAFYRGRSCRCFGALSRRKFDVTAIFRSAVITAVAVAAMSGVRPASVQVGAAARVLLLAAACVLALAAFTAAEALAVGREAQEGLAP